jgi:hypothetical protein
MTQHQRARLADYAPWILRDYFSNQGPATALVLLLVGFATVGPQMAFYNQKFILGEVPAPMAAALLQSMAERLSFLGAFFATNGIVANDRKLGYYRFLFAKPVKPASYYATTFLLYGLGLTAVAIILALVWGATVRPAFTVELFLIVALMYLAYGGLGFLLSAAWRFDWLSLVTGTGCCTSFRRCIGMTRYSHCSHRRPTIRCRGCPSCGWVATVSSASFSE